MLSLDRTVMLRTQTFNVEAERGALGGALQQPSPLGECGATSDHVCLV